jgi:hypothetical protein
VVYLIKRALSHLEPNRVDVVEFDPDGRGARDNPVGQRYRSLFGDGIRWHPEGLEAWLESRKQVLGTTKGADDVELVVLYDLDSI